MGGIEAIDDHLHLMSTNSLEKHPSSVKNATSQLFRSREAIRNGGTSFGDSLIPFVDKHRLPVSSDALKSQQSITSQYRMSRLNIATGYSRRKGSKTHKNSRVTICFLEI